MRAKFLLAVLAVIAVVLAGCGSSNRQLTYAQLVSKADAICKDADAKTKAIPQPTGQNLTQVADFLQKQLDVIEPAINKVKEFKPPAALQSQYDAWIKSSEESLANGKDALAAAKANKQAEFQAAATKAEQLHTKTNQLAADVGMKVCSTD